MRVCTTPARDSRKDTGKLADQGAASPESTGLVEKRRDLGGGTSVSGRETEKEPVTVVPSG